MGGDTLATAIAEAPRLRPGGRWLPFILGRDWAGHLFLLPWFVGFFGLTLGPALASLYLSFTRFELLDSPRWIGWANYAKLAGNDPSFAQSLGVTGLYVLLSVPLKLAFALSVALMLNRGSRFTPFYRAIFYLPSLIGASVAISILWRLAFSGDGLFNQVLAVFGWHGINWVGTPETALYTLVLLSVWQFGSPMVIFLAGLRQIPKDMYEAASLDGASTMRQFISVTLPLLTPVLFFNVVVQTIDAFKAFTPAYIISQGTGGPSNATLFYTLYIFQQAFSFFHMGYAAALAWVLVILVAAVTALSFLSARYWVHYSD